MGCWLEFGDPDEQLLAARIVSRDLEAVIQIIENALDEREFTVTERCMSPPPNMVLFFKIDLGDGARTEFYLNNAIAEWLSMDRDEEPLRLDRRCLNEDMSRSIMSGIIESRVSLFAQMKEAGGDPAKLASLAEHLEATGAYERVRIYKREREQ